MYRSLSPEQRKELEDELADIEKRRVEIKKILATIAVELKEDWW
tara:strand:- start:193 stop:324 length:132 start_codon:yes stop_codon:yes gene_type:complete